MPFNGQNMGNKFRAKPVMYKGKEYVVRDLSRLPESELSESSIRTNLIELRALVDEGKAELNDESILQCLKKKQPKYEKKPYNSEYHKKLTTKKQIKEAKEAESWELLGKLF